MLLLFCVVFNNFLTIPVEIENERLKLALPIPTCAPITVANDAIEKLLLIATIAIKDQNS